MSGKLFHAPFVTAHSGFELTAVVERSAQNASNIYPDITSYDSVDAILGDKSIELIVVNTPNDTHFEFALKAIRQHKHVLIEKPLTVTSAEAIELFHEAEKNNCLVMPFQNRRYDSDFLSVKQVLDSAVLGQPIEAHFRFDRYKTALSNKLAKETATSGSGLQYDLGPRLLDAAISLFGLPLSWTKSLGHFRPNTRVDDYAHFQLSYPNGLQVFVTASLLVANEQPAFIINGTNGSYVKQRTDSQENQLLNGVNVTDANFGVEAVGKEGILTLVSENGLKTHHKIDPIKSSYLNLFEQVHEAIRAGKLYPITKSQVIKQIEILEE